MILKACQTYRSICCGEGKISRRYCLVLCAITISYSKKKKTLIFVVQQNAVIFLFCVVCYGPAIPDSTFVFDDLVAIVRNKDVTNIDCNIWTSIARIFRHDFWGLDITDDASHKSYRPFITLTYNIEYRIFDGGKLPLPAIMKCHNLIIHYFVCCILLSVLRQIFTRLKRSVSLLATILFAIHPVHTEAVSGIVGRADLMCSVFYLLALRTFCNITKGLAMS